MTQTQPQTPWHQCGALTEVLLVFFAGSLISQLLFSMAGITSNPLATIAQQADPDYLALSVDIGMILILQYAGWMLLALVLCWILTGRPLHSNAITCNGQPWLKLITLGVIMWALADMPNKILWLLDAELDIGKSVPWREALLNAERTMQWWVFMAVGSLCWCLCSKKYSGEAMYRAVCSGLFLRPWPSSPPH